MTNDEVKAMIAAALDGAQIDLSGDGSHFDARIVWSGFEGQRTLERQRAVFASLGDSITSGRLHNLNIQALTPDEV